MEKESTKQDTIKNIISDSQMNSQVVYTMGVLDHFSMEAPSPPHRAPSSVWSSLSVASELLFDGEPTPPSSVWFYNHFPSLWLLDHFSMRADQDAATPALRRVQNSPPGTNTMGPAPPPWRAPYIGPLSPI